MFLAFQGSSAERLNFLSVVSILTFRVLTYTCNLSYVLSQLPNSFQKSAGKCFFAVQGVCSICVYESLKSSTWVWRFSWKSPGSTFLWCCLLFYTVLSVLAYTSLKWTPSVRPCHSWLIFLESLCKADNFWNWTLNVGFNGASFKELTVQGVLIWKTANEIA